MSHIRRPRRLAKSIPQRQAISEDPDEKTASTTTDSEEPAAPQHLLQLVAKIGSPIALGTALLFYFGWARAESQARALGYDITLVGLGTTDYVLRSITVLFFPLALVIVLAIVFYALDPLVVRSIEGSAGSRFTRIIVLLLRIAWLWCPVIGLLIFALVPSARDALIPLILTITILLALYGDRLNRRLHRSGPAPATLTTLAVTLLAVALFLGTERLATLTGQSFARIVASEPSRYARVVILSPKRLELPAAVSEKQIGSEESFYRFRYEGLRLLIYSNSKYFLLSYQQTKPYPAVIVLPDTPELRVEFQA